MTRQEREAVERLKKSVLDFAEALAPMAKFVDAFGVALSEFAKALARVDPVTGQFRDVGEKVEAPTNEAQALPDELVDRLSDLFAETFYANEARFSMGIRAVLSELAKAPVESPSLEDIRHAADSSGIFPFHQRIESMFHARVAPVIAAKDAEIKRQEQVIRVQNETLAQQDTRTKETISALVAEANRDAEKHRLLLVENERLRFQMTKGQSVVDSLRSGIQDHAAANASLNEKNNELHKRIFELKKDAEEKQATAHAYVASLEKRIAEKDEQYAASYRMYEVLVERHSELKTDNESLEKRVTELTAPVIVDGKTPGQTSHKARRMATLARALPFYETDIYDGKPVDNDAIEEYAAREVLRAFGGEALRRVRDRIHAMKIAMWQDAVPLALTIVDDELAKMEGK